MKGCRWLLILWMFHLVPVQIKGQESGTRPETRLPWIIGSRLHTGYLINHRNTMKIMNEKNPGAIEITIARTTNGEKPWQSFYCNPHYSASFMMFDLGSPSYLGKAYCVYPSLHFFLIGEHRKISLNMQFGSGIAYVEKIFDRIDNYKNTSISTHFNALLVYRMEGRIKVIEPLYLSGGWAFSHISNGTICKPNAGLNYLTVFAGAGYLFGKEKKTSQMVDTYSDADRKWHYTVYFSGGVKSYTVDDDTKFAVSGLSFEVSAPHFAFTRANISLELFYDASDYDYLINHESYDEGKNLTKIQTLKPAFSAGYVFLFGSLSANVQIGRYFYAQNQRYGIIYQRMALGYEITNRLNTRLALKTHWGQADYIELALGYRIR